MFQNVRQSMAWMHTWFGLVLGFVLMVSFFFGTLSVFDREIDRWAIPETRFAPQPMPSFDRVLRPIFERMQPDAEALAEARTLNRSPLPERFAPSGWGFYATHRDPVLDLWAEFDLPDPKDPMEDHVHVGATIDPRNGASIRDDRFALGSEFFYPMHYSLNLYWYELGVWIVGLGALAMLAALVSGLVMHRRMFREFFTFRPDKSTQRSVLDLHNLTGVLALPFHFFFAFTGLVIFVGQYFPVADVMMGEQRVEAAMLAETRETGIPTEAAGRPAPLASVDTMVAEARRRWAEAGKAGEVGMLSVEHVGDVNSVVSIYRAGTDRVSSISDGMHFMGATGRLIHEDPPSSILVGTGEFLEGLHLQHFRPALAAALAVRVGRADGLRMHCHGLSLLCGKAQEAACPAGQGRLPLGGCAGCDHRDRHGGGHGGHPGGEPGTARGPASAGRLAGADLLGRVAAGVAARRLAQCTGGAGAHLAGLARAVLGRSRAGGECGAAQLDHHW